jgi:SulP family sulfate permease
MARTIRASGEPAVDNNQELLANGVATLAGAFFRAMPAAGGFSQSAVSRAAGARTQVSQLATIGLAVLTAFFLGPVLSQLPQATWARWSSRPCSG